MKKTLHRYFTALAVLLLPCAAHAQTVLYTENFSSGVLPTGWSNDSLGLIPQNVWLFDDPYLRAVTGAGFDANYAIFDSDEGSVNDGIDELASLTTVDYDLSAVAGAITLELDQQYRSLLGPNTTGSSYRIEYSSDAGTSWTTLDYDSMDLGYPTAVHTTYNISAAAGSATVRFRFTWTGTWDWWWAIDNLQIISYPSCTTTPVAGTTISTKSLVCYIWPFNLSLTGNDYYTLYSYQWYSSSDGILYGPIAGATDSMLNATTTAITKYYYCRITCQSYSSNSTPVVVYPIPATLCPCLADHAGFDCAAGMISNVSITGTTLNNSSACDDLTGIAYSYYPYSPSTSAMLTSGVAYDFNVMTEDDNIISIWIDFNQDGTLDASEWVQVCTTSLASTVNTVNWTMPTFATPGPAIMRVRSRFTGNINDGTSSCLQFSSGETEDYIVGLDFDVSVHNMIKLDGVTIFPNPATDFISVFFNHYLTKAVLTLVDATGKIVSSETIDNVFSKRLDTSSLPNGLYVLHITTGEKELTQKIVINK